MNQYVQKRNKSLSWKLGLVNNHPITVSIVMLLYKRHMFAFLYLFCMDLLLSVVTFTNGHNFLGIYLAFVKNKIETSQWYYCYHEIAKTLLWCYCNLGRYSTNVYTGEAPPLGPTPYSFTYHFSWKRYPFHIPFIDK